jgi:pyrroline-5-carboxylate reductase
MAAGLTMERITSLAGGDYPIIRIMPTIPCAVGAGVILYDSANGVTAEELAFFTDVMTGAGLVDQLDEHLIDAGCSISGCGPAFVSMFIEALADGGVECGLPRDKALALAAQTVSGAADMVLSSGEHPGKLKDNVCSPGGTTIAGVHALEEGCFRATSMNAVKAAYDKTKKLG